MIWNSTKLAAGDTLPTMCYIVHVDTMQGRRTYVCATDAGLDRLLHRFTGQPAAQIDDIDHLPGIQILRDVHLYS